MAFWFNGLQDLQISDKVVQLARVDDIIDYFESLLKLLFMICVTYV